MTLIVKAYSGLGPGQHEANVTGCSIETSKRFGGQYLRWEYTDANGRTATENSSLDITPGNRTGKRFAAITGRPVVVDEHRELSEVIGKPVSIFIEMDGDYPKVVSVVARDAAPVHRTATSEAVAYRSEAEAAEAIHKAQEADPTEHDPDALPF